MTIADLQHEMDAIAMQFEEYVRERVPADGSRSEDFETWREAFYEAFDHPDDEASRQVAEDALSQLLDNPHAKKRKAE